jgi:DNA (cytosine-5)-methyltransferase 1
MKHLGDITRLNGAKIEPVDVITGGSPCQDLSVAGKRAGLSGDRSGLFREQMRLVREMREATGRVYPQFMIWENVPGPLSTNKGADFREVLNECVKIVKETAPDVPMPEKGGWPRAGVLYDEMGRWSIAWRIHDAQFWGVPQRRRRIALVCDFRGMRAPEVLFEQQGVPGNTEQSDAQGKRTACASDECVTEPDKVWDARGNGDGNLCSTLTGDHDNRITDYTNVVVYGIDDVRAGTHRPVVLKGCSPTLISHSANGVCVCSQTYCVGNGQVHDAISPSVELSETLNRLIDLMKTALPVVEDRVKSEEVSQTLNCMHDPMTILEPCAYQLVGVNSNSMKSSNPNSGCYETEQAGTITTNGCVPNNQGGTAIIEPVSNSKVYGICSYSSNCMKSSNPHSGVYEAETSRTLDTVSCGNPVCCQGGMAVVDQSPFILDRAAFNQGKNAQFDIKIEETETVPSMVARGPHAVAQPVQYRVRRLTPLECTRLQGYPDGWVDIGDWIDTKGKKHKDADAPKYKALGNSIALPFWKWLLARIYAECKAESLDPTLGSLFDGIGGFPLSWPGRTAWSSEIDEFPLAVLRARFGEEQENDE